MRGIQYSFEAVRQFDYAKRFTAPITFRGSFPRQKPLQPYLNDCYKCESQKLKQKCKDNTVKFFYDETYDAQSRFVSCGSLALLPPGNTEIPPYFAEEFLGREHVHSSKVSQQIVTALSDTVPFIDAIRLFESDSPMKIISLPYLEKGFFVIVSQKDLLQIQKRRSCIKLQKLLPVMSN